MDRLNINQLGTVGKAGEDAAADYLMKQGFSVIGRNIKYGKLETDIICTDPDGRHIVFVEVKSRTVPASPGRGRFGSPSAAVDRSKKQHLVEAARDWIKENRPSGLFPRMDVIEVYLRSSDGTDGNAGNKKFEVEKLNHFKNAFGVNF
ncbi:MAG: YraN family protein [Clostridia bacterium]|nr:YraN family protein [Clostridia bacterium]